MQKALELKNTRALNSFLADNFDVVGATEVKQLITQAQDLTDKALEAEKEPISAMKQIEAETAQARSMQRASQIDGIIRQSKNAWVRSLTKISEEGKVLELIPSDTDEDFNERIVTPIRDKAAQEYGKIVKALAEKGLTHLDDDLGAALAKMVQLAIASSVAIETRSRAQAETETLRANSSRTNKFIRPSLGGGTNTSPGSSSGPKSPSEAADMALNQVMGKR
jgi:vacuolar-type H+-ATPase subunit I/STV1